MVRKEDLKGKYIEYIDNDGKYRIDKVTKITGNQLSVKNCLGRRRRIKKEKVICRMRPKLGREEIIW